MSLKILPGIIRIVDNHYFLTIKDSLLSNGSLHGSIMIHDDGESSSLVVKSESYKDDLELVICNQNSLAYIVDSENDSNSKIVDYDGLLANEENHYYLLLDEVTGIPLIMDDKVVLMINVSQLDLEELSEELNKEDNG